MIKALIAAVRNGALVTPAAKKIPATTRDPWLQRRPPSGGWLGSRP